MYGFTVGCRLYKMHRTFMYSNGIEWNKSKKKRDKMIIMDRLEENIAKTE